MPILICAADGEEKAAGKTSNRNPNAKRRGSFIYFLEPSQACLISAAPGTGEFDSKKFWRGVIPPPAIETLT
jgi:hypothetical protein